MYKNLLFKIKDLYLYTKQFDHTKYTLHIYTNKNTFFSIKTVKSAKTRQKNPPYWPSWTRRTPRRGRWWCRSAPKGSVGRGAPYNPWQGHPETLLSTGTVNLNILSVTSHHSFNLMKILRIVFKTWHWQGRIVHRSSFENEKKYKTKKNNLIF